MAETDRNSSGHKVRRIRIVLRRRYGLSPWKPSGSQVRTGRPDTSPRNTLIFLRLASGTGPAGFRMLIRDVTRGGDCSGSSSFCTCRIAAAIQAALAALFDPLWGPKLGWADAVTLLVGNRIAIQERAWVNFLVTPVSPLGVQEQGDTVSVLAHRSGCVHHYAGLDHPRQSSLPFAK